MWINIATAKLIAAISLGFLTLPMVAGVIAGLSEGGSFIATFGLSSGAYWTGFFLFIGLVTIAVCIGTLVWPS